MKGIYGSENNTTKCPNCGSPSGSKVICQNCNTQGCTNCVGMEKPYDCKVCGKGPIVYID